MRRTCIRRGVAHARAVTPVPAIQWTRVAVAGVLACALPGANGLARAQGVVTGGATGGVVTVSGQPTAGGRPRLSAGPSRNSCQQIASTPSPLVGSPQGMALLKMHAELSSVAANMADTVGARGDVRRVTILRQGVDSLARVYVRSLPSASADTVRGMAVRVQDDSNHIFVRGTNLPVGTLMRTNAPGDAERMQIELMIRALEPQVAQMSRGRDPLPFDIVISRSENAPGYMGVTASARNVSTVINGETRVGYCEYPMVETIEPGSPAAKAGLLTGDTLLAFNGLDLRQYDVNYTRLLVPGQTVRMRLRRDGKTRDIGVVVARRPVDTEALPPERASCEPGEPKDLCDMRLTSMMRALRFAPPPRPGNGTPSAAQLDVRYRAGGPAADIPLQLQITPQTSFAIFAGARLSPIGDELAANLGIDAGLLVMDVANGSVAAESGLRSGETVTEVNGTEVRDVVALRRALQLHAAEHTASLRVSARAVAGRTAADRAAHPTPRVVVVRW